MIYATTALSVERLDPHSTERRHLALDAELDRLGRERSRVERTILSSLPGRLMPAPGSQLRGDVVLVMVDEGEGEAVRKEIAEFLKSSVVE